MMAFHFSNHIYTQQHSFIVAWTGQLPIFVLKASENSICWEVCFDIYKFVSLFYQFPVPTA